MDRVFSPTEIEFLLHCYYCGAEHPEIRNNNFYQAVAERLENVGLIYKKEYQDLDAMVYLATDIGEAHIDQILSLPIPQRKIVLHSGEVFEK